jgi:RNA polymerase sigma factor (sigma-70 family)
MSRTSATIGRRSVERVNTDLASHGPGDLVVRALAGDRDAWTQIVHRYERVAWKVLTGFDLSPEDRNDVFASTFFRLFERLASIREPEKLPGWIATTTRNEALTLLRSRARETPVDTFADEASAPGSEPDARMLDLELRAALRIAFASLPDECRDLLVLFTVDPPLTYDEIAEITGRPRGSLGPSRARCLERLRRSPELATYLEGTR